MNFQIDPSLIDWSRAQFALTALYHWIFVPLTLGLAVIQGIMETIYYRTGSPFWRQTAKFWMKIFGINFAIGVATGIILEFEFGTNWSNYSWFVGDIFGAPLAVEGILAFFMEATFVAVMYFGWDKVSRRFHLAATWLTGLGATLSAWWILVANAWMQNPVGMAFNPDTARNEMVSFAQVALSPMAVAKFFHSVWSGWVVAACVVIGISCWYLWKRRNVHFAKQSIKVAAWVGIVGAFIVALTGDSSAYQVAQVQPMKLAAMEGYYDGQEGAGLIAVAVLNPEKQTPDDGVQPFLLRFEVPYMLSILAERDPKAFVPGINDLINGGYTLKDGTQAPSAAERIESGRQAIAAFADYRAAQDAGNTDAAQQARTTLEQNIHNFGYGYLSEPNDIVPSVPISFYSFRIMVMLGCYLLLFFLVVLFLSYKKQIEQIRWLHPIGMITILLGYMAGMAGWVLAECGRQPWAIQDMLPTSAAISNLSTATVQTTFFIFLIFFIIMYIAEAGILLKAIRKGPELPQTDVA